MTREDWEVVKLGDVCNNIRKVFWKNETETIFLWLEHISQWSLLILGHGTSSDLASGVIRFQQWDVLFGKMRPYFRKVVRPKFNWTCSPEFFVIRTNWKVDQSYLFYQVANQDFVDKVTASTQWVDRPRAKREVVKEFEISLPPLAEQQRIASILSTYDDLIENNTRRIALLEQMAQTLYRQWFVEYKFPGCQDVEMVESGTEFGMIPQGWEVKKIGDEIAKIKRAKKVQSKEYLSEWSIPIIDQSRWYIAWYTEDEMYLQTSPLPIVVFWDHTRIVKYIPFPFASGADGTQLMYPKNEKMLPNYFYLAILQTEVPNYHYERHYKFLQDKYIIIPSDYILDQFHIQTIPMFDEILSIQKQNQSLKEQRDILLRKLIG